MASSVYSKKLETQIFTRIAGGESLKKICSEPDMPARSTIMLWVINDNPPGVSDRYARACIARAELWADELVEITDDIESDPDPKSRAVRLDARKWTASKLLRTKYGDAVSVKLTGDPNEPITVQNISNLTDEELANRAKELADKVKDQE